jgi:hypothetical protein
MNAPTHDDLAELRGGIRKIHEQSGGALHIEVVRQTDISVIVAASMTSDHAATSTDRIVAKVIRSVSLATENEPPICCVFRSNAATDSGGSRPPIPVKPAT